MTWRDEDRLHEAESEVDRLTFALSDARMEIATLREALDGLVSVNEDTEPLVAYTAWLTARSAIREPSQKFDSDVVKALEDITDRYEAAAHSHGFINLGSVDAAINAARAALAKAKQP